MLRYFIFYKPTPIPTKLQCGCAPLVTSWTIKALFTVLVNLPCEIQYLHIFVILNLKKKNKFPSLTEAEIL